MAALRARPRAFALTALAVVLLDIGLPPLVLSVARTPWTFFTFNPWLKQLPAYVMGPAPLGEKLDFLTRVALFWFSADGPYGMPEWGFAVDTTDLARFLATGVLVGLFVALVLHQRGRGWRPAMSHGGGVIGACASVLGLTTGPCSVVGCGAPVLPVVGLVFAGLSSGTLALLSYGSRVATIVVFAGLGASIVYLGWQLGRPRASGRGARRTASRDFTAGVH
jgi:hypothetical protein